MFAAINTFLSGGASAPLNTVAPAVTGTAAAGQTLSCTSGTWTGSLPITYTYQWQHGTTNISAATSSTYVLDRSYIGETIRCVVTATNAIGAPTANSNATSAVVAVPLNTVAPAVTGTATNGQTLSCSTGTWTGTATITYSYQWKRAGSNVGSNSTTYVLSDADVGSVMSCVVTGTNGQGSATGTSNSTGAVAAIVPGAPTGVSASATSDTTATIYFSAPSSNGGAAISSYTVYCSGGQTGTGGGSGISVGGLVAATAYTFTVRATNSAGTGGYSSASGSITTLHAAGSAYFGSGGTWTAPAGITSITVTGQGGNGTSDGPVDTSAGWDINVVGGSGYANLLDGPGGLDWSSPYGAAVSSQSAMAAAVGGNWGGGEIGGSWTLASGDQMWTSNGSWGGYAGKHVYSVGAVTAWNYGYGTPPSSGAATFSGAWGYPFTIAGPGNAGTSTTAFGYTWAGGTYTAPTGNAGQYYSTGVSVSPGTGYSISPGSTSGYISISWAAQ